MESSHKSHAIELEFISVAQCQISDDATESVATHSSRPQPAIICMPQLQPWGSTALEPTFYDPEVKDEGSGHRWA